MMDEQYPFNITVSSRLTLEKGSILRTSVCNIDPQGGYRIPYLMVSYWCRCGISVALDSDIKYQQLQQIKRRETFQSLVKKGFV